MTFLTTCFLTLQILISLEVVQMEKLPPLNSSYYQLPAGFRMGAATSAYQIEGGWNEDGKSPSIWDTFSRSVGKTEGTGDVACDSYHRYLEDVEVLKQLGVDHYRFSLSWSRILPNGDSTLINQPGIDYYHRLIDALLANGIEPMVTIYHWDLPQVLQDIGGWVNPEMETYFADFAKLAFTTYGDKVKVWFTINEPRLICRYGYGSGLFAPGVVSSGVDEYQCVRTVLKAHAKAYHIYDEQFRPTQNGKVSYVLDAQWAEPATNSPQDIEAAERIMQFSVGLYGNAVYHKDGDFPKVVIDRIADRSQKEGSAQSRLVPLTTEEIEYIRGTSDFLSFNTYLTYKAKWQEDAPIGTPSYEKDLSVESLLDPQWELQAFGWGVVPWGMRHLLNWLDKTYQHPAIMITENGFGDVDGKLEDTNRQTYYQEYLRNILIALYEDGVNVTGYTAWSLMDNYEWTSGTTVKFGLVHVDFNDPERTRTIKKSGEFYRQIITTRSLRNSGDHLSSTIFTLTALFLLTTLLQV